MTVKIRYFEATLTSDMTGEEKISGTFLEEEHECLVDFMEYAERLAETPFLRSSNRGSAKISQQSEGPLNFDVVLPDWTEVEVFIHRLRPIILENESTSFYKISSLIGKYASSSQLVKYMLKDQKELFSGRRDQSRIQIRSNGELINSEKALQAYLNAFEYHRDKGKQSFLAELHQIMPLEVSKVLFVGLLLDKAKAIFALRNLVAGITGKNRRLELNALVPLGQIGE